MNMKAWSLLVVVGFLFSCDFQEQSTDSAGQSTSPKKGKNSDFPSKAIIEIPSGTNAKFEIDKNSGQLFIEQIDGNPRRINYLPYPSNYGMIPGTLQSEEEGGDGDPLDVIVLGPALEAGSDIPVRFIGVLKLLDGGEIDDKLIAVSEGNPFSELNSLSELQEDFPGATEILRLWFLNYKGPGEMEVIGWGDELEARAMLERSMIEE
jgi:inorganic pyrophosphatase